MALSPTIQILATPADLFHAAAEEFIRVGRVAIGGQGRFTVALSGGSTPRGLHAVLAKDHADFAWNRTHIFFSDERHVPPDHPDSNYGMANETLLTKATIPAENVHRVRTENSDAAKTAVQYDADIRSFFELRAGEFPRFDLILLGLGPDGHTASLFPGSEGLREQSKLVIANWVEKFKTFRISFTFPVINHAAEVMFMVSGADKAEAVRQVLKGGGTPPLPAQRVQPTDGKLMWVLDEAAAANLRR
jgi:6-phosphogluconolactonase